jgi:pimeloyl-ACP methyl ester carboxylesterase
MSANRMSMVCWAGVVALFVAQPAHAGWRDYVSPSKGWQKIKKYTNDKIEKARADQQKIYGLKLPENYDPAGPLVVLIHGVDSGPGMWWSMGEHLKESGRQYGFFNYASDAPVKGAIESLTREMEALHTKHPQARVHFIAHSMGGLVARGYIEGERYALPTAQAVEKFIAIAPPNHGSCWAMCRWTLEFNEQYWLWKTNKDWSPIWAYTDGRGEAGDDIEPGSKFLKDLNARPRRDGVRYTIIAGNHNAAARMGANAVDAVEGLIPNKDWWGVRQVRSGLDMAQTKLRKQEGPGDGVVDVESAKLEGVADIVILHADHAALAMGVAGRPPAAWDVVNERLRD